MTPEDATYEGAVAGISQLQTFLDTYPCQANKNGSAYFYFEPFDEPVSFFTFAGGIKLIVELTNSFVRTVERAIRRW